MPLIALWGVNLSLSSLLIKLTISSRAQLTVVQPLPVHTQNVSHAAYIAVGSVCACLIKLISSSTGPAVCNASRETIKRLQCSKCTMIICNEWPACIHRSSLRDDHGDATMGFV